MKASSEGHGQSIYAVADSEGSALQGQVRFFDDDGELAPELIHLDLESLTVGICSRADRQLRVTQLSPYKRYFGKAGKADAPRLALLQRLGAAMQFNDFADVAGDIPAGYTYLGQFIFHDLSSMIEGPVATRPKNLRSAALDLDSVFGSPNEELENGQSLHCPQRFEQSELHFTLAAELNPNSPKTLVSAAVGLAFMGRTDQARELLDHATSLTTRFLDYQWCYIATTR